MWFDLSHGSSNFSFDVARKAMEQDFVVDTISTDLHTANITGPVRSMADTIGEILSLADEEIFERLHSLLQRESFLTYVDTSVIYPQIQKNPSSIYSFLLVAG